MTPVLHFDRFYPSHARTFFFSGRTHLTLCIKGQATLSYWRHFEGHEKNDIYQNPSNHVFRSPPCHAVTAGEHSAPSPDHHILFSSNYRLSLCHPGLDQPVPYLTSLNVHQSDPSKTQWCWRSLRHSPVSLSLLSLRPPPPSHLCLIM